MVLWFLIKLVAVLRPSLRDIFRFRQCVSIFVVDDFGLRRPLSSDLFNHIFANFLWVLVRLFHMLTPLFEIISLVCICRLPKLLDEPCPTLQVSCALSRALLFCLSSATGIVIYLPGSHKYKILSLLTNATVWDGQFIEVTSKKTNTNIIIGNIYRPPRELVANYQTFINELLPVLSLLQTLKPDVVIAGDTNINLLNVNENKKIAEFFDAIIS